jgi:drug/metabolite transporter (DMT)-like permease
MAPSAVAIMVVLCALWGAQQVAIKLAHQGGLPAIAMGAMRSGGAALLLCLWIMWRQGGGALRRMLRPLVLGPGLVVGLLFGVEFLALFPGVILTTAARGVLFLYTAPFFTALFAHVFLPQERLRPRQAMGLAIAFAGVALAFADGLGDPGGSIAGDLLCALAGMLWGATTVFLKASPVMRAEPAECMLLYQLAVSAALIGTAAAVAGPEWQAAAVSGLAWLCLLYQTAIVTFASYLVWFWLVKRNRAASLSGLTFLAPLFGIAGGALVLGERASPALLAGLVAVAVGLRFLLAQPRRTVAV